MTAATKYIHLVELNAAQYVQLEAMSAVNVPWTFLLQLLFCMLTFQAGAILG